ncbi:hypothetical protein [Citrobacter freundii]|uniref:hypothetical protein n=1 Tax=Citrobacter freundii TaxID=546 RepID=UPI0023AE9E23|nr:hypothetical protein [Citrobacter freundii]
MQTINNRMTETQIADLFSLAVQLQVKAEESDDRDTAILAYSIQNACSNLTESQREFRAADATIHNMELKLTDMAVQLANAESKCRELAEFKSRVYAQMGAGCEAPEFAITEGLNNLRRFADTLHAIEREFFTKEVPDEECEGETVEECPLCWGMTVEQYVSEFGKCLAEVRASAIKSALTDCSEYLDRDCIMESNGISYDDAALREIGAMALQEELLRKGAAL